MKSMVVILIGALCAPVLVQAERFGNAPEILPYQQQVPQQMPPQQLPPQQFPQQQYQLPQQQYQYPGQPPQYLPPTYPPQYPPGQYPVVPGYPPNHGGGQMNILPMGDTCTFSRRVIPQIGVLVREDSCRLKMPMTVNAPCDPDIHCKRKVKGDINRSGRVTLRIRPQPY